MTDLIQALERNVVGSLCLFFTLLVVIDFILTALRIMFGKELPPESEEEK